MSGPEWLVATRTAAAERFGGQPLPSGSEEIWRYSRIAELDLEARVPVVAPVEATGAVPADLAWVTRAVGDVAAVLVVDHGRVAHVTVAPEWSDRGLLVTDLSADPSPDAAMDDLAGTDAFVDLNTAFCPGPVMVRVPAGLVVDAPVLVLSTMGASGSAAFPRLVVEVGSGAEASVIEHLSSVGDGADGNGLACPVVDLRVGDAGRLGYLNVQDLGSGVWNLGYQASRVGRDAHLDSTVVALGGDYARVRADSTLAGKGGTSKLSAVYFADGNRMHDFRTIQDHAAPSTTSDLLFKGTVADHARSVYSGLIRVRKDAPGTNAFQTNRNLVLSPGASAESVPNLEIENNDVRCSHASAVGPIDPEHLYYLESRGLPPEVARRLVVLGFFDDVLGGVGARGLVAAVRAEVTRRLSGIKELRV